MSLSFALLVPLAYPCSPLMERARLFPRDGAEGVPLDAVLRVDGDELLDTVLRLERDGELVLEASGEDPVIDVGELTPDADYVATLVGPNGGTLDQAAFRTGTELAEAPVEPEVEITDVRRENAPMFGDSCDWDHREVDTRVHLGAIDPFAALHVTLVEDEDWEMGDPDIAADDLIFPQDRESVEVLLESVPVDGPSCAVAWVENAAGVASDASLVCERAGGCSAAGGRSGAGLTLLATAALLVGRRRGGAAAAR